MKWFRFYSEVLDDPKVQRLPGELFKTWVNLLCLANRSDERGVLPPVADIAFALRVTETQATKALKELSDRGLLEEGESGTMPHNWAERQPESDTPAAAAARKRRQRDRERRSRQRDTDGHSDCHCDSESDGHANVAPQKEKENKKKKLPPVSPPSQGDEPTGEKRRRATSLPPDWKPNAKHHELAEELGVDLQSELEQFLDHHTAKGTRFKDWDAAFRTWLRNAKRFNRSSGAPGAGGYTMSDEEAARWESLQ